MSNQIGFQEKLSLFFKEYIDSLRDDEDSLEEYYNTPKGYAISELKLFLEFHNFELPNWIKEYYEPTKKL